MKKFLCLPIAVALISPALAVTPPCVQVVGDLLSPFDDQGEVEAEGAVTDALGSLLISSRATHIVQIDLTWQTLTESGIAGIFPLGVASFEVWIYNPNRVSLLPTTSMLTVTPNQGYRLFEPGGEQHITVVVVDTPGAGATATGAVVNVCGQGSGDTGCDNPFDLDCDGTAGPGDIAALIACLASGGAECDCDGDGVTSFADLAACLASFDGDQPPCP